MAAKIKSGDLVVVVRGRDKGKQGKVLKVIKRVERNKKGEVIRVKTRVVVEGVNIRKKHVKATQFSEGGIIEFEAPIDISNVMLVDPKTGKPTRVGFEIVEENGYLVKYRVAKKSGTRLDVVSKQPVKK
ncbi:MAG TPA: 50S ribosomal protein L24 [Aquifex aeolicus]|uniref:Large ribosomal subunit protein uL24 n=1 Tax=Aquifex aeolicus TaxID=63363 RepID=A0A9D0YPL6_AQUAO|nr:50S ribosomal protein L24 [Aquificales bacterium]HIP86296.1 50S ribosomal protein L24 [Aquifex sp.]HIP98517.1 50S ribosomal protein L24 [Aquifex aeolicus]HIQ26248.1 50S ribosomal protein L24 [Aquifex aeolicus]